MRCWEATDTSDGSTVGPKWSYNPPQSWLDDSLIEDIHATCDIDDGEACWKEIANYIDNTAGWSDAKQNDILSKYSLFRERIEIGYWTRAKDVLQNAVDNGHVTSSEQTDIENLIAKYE